METPELQTETPDFELYFQLRNLLVKRLIGVLHTFVSASTSSGAHFQKYISSKTVKING